MAQHRTRRRHVPDQPLQDDDRDGQVLARVLRPVCARRWPASAVRTGGLEVAYTKERWRDLRRKQGWAKAYGLPSELLSPQETQQLVEILNPKVIHGAFYTPRDAVAKGVRLMTAIIRAAKELGVESTATRPCRILRFSMARWWRVQTSQARIAADYVLLCTNIWGPLLPDKYGRQGRRRRRVDRPCDAATGGAG